MDRYIAVQEPTCTWAVFDTFDDVPVEIGNSVMIGLGKRDAMAIASSANSVETVRTHPKAGSCPLRLVWVRAA